MKEEKQTIWEWLAKWILILWLHIKEYWQSALKLKLRIETLDERWWDKDHIMLHACFQLLVNFFEQEKPKEHCVMNEGLRELKRLYIWWTEERPQREDPYADDHFEGIRRPSALRQLDGNGDDMSAVRGNFQEYFKVLERCAEQERLFEREDQEALERLIKLRGFMWT